MQFWNILDVKDKADFLKLVEKILTYEPPQAGIKYYPSTILTYIHFINEYIHADESNKEPRILVSGIYYDNEKLLINTKQLKQMLKMSKSSINSALQQIGFTLSKHPGARRLILKYLPHLEVYPEIHRQWTMRQVGIPIIPQPPKVRRATLQAPPMAQYIIQSQLQMQMQLQQSYQMQVQMNQSYANQIIQPTQVLPTSPQSAQQQLPMSAQVSHRMQTRETNKHRKKHVVEEPPPTPPKELKDPPQPITENANSSNKYPKPKIISLDQFSSREFTFFYSLGTFDADSVF